MYHPSDPHPATATGHGTPKKSVGIVTDSTADIPADLAGELDIAIIPCQVDLGDQAYLDGHGLSTQEFLELLRNSAHRPRTAHPPLRYFADTYHRLLDADRVEGIISLHVASSLSGTVNAAWAAAQMLPDPSRVDVVDTGQLSMGTGWAVLEAARLASAGADRRMICSTVRELLVRLRVVAMIDALDSLYRGGRISQIAAVLGTAMRIKPLLRLENGKLSVLGQVRTRSRAMQRLEAEVRAWGPLAEVAVVHVGAEEAAVQLVEALNDLIPAQGPILAAAGLAVAAHLGEGAVGVCALLHGERVC